MESMGRSEQDVRNALRSFGRDAQAQFGSNIGSFGAGSPHGGAPPRDPMLPSHAGGGGGIPWSLVIGLAVGIALTAIVVVLYSRWKKGGAALAEPASVSQPPVAQPPPRQFSADDVINALVKSQLALASRGQARATRAAPFVKTDDNSNLVDDILGHSPNPEAVENVPPKAMETADPNFTPLD